MHTAHRQDVRTLPHTRPSLTRVASLIASKLYYFSCGGGTRQFEELVDKSAVLSSSVVKHIEDQQSNIREILQLQFKRSAH